MTQVNVNQVKAQLSKLLDRALAGEEVVIMRSGKPLVRLTPVETVPARRTQGTARGEFVVPDDFDEPLPDEVLALFEGSST